MRKITLILAAILLLSFTGCDMINGIIKKATLGEKTDTPDVSEKGAEVTVISSDSSSLTVKIENNTDSTWQSGNMRDYRLEAQNDGEWFEVLQTGEFANTMELMIFAPGERITHTFLFSERYGKLAEGRYRVVKFFWANKTETEDAHEFVLICEFDVK